MLRYTLLVSIVVVLSISVPAFSAIMESEPNDSIATADLIPDPGFDPWGEVVMADLFVGDVDYFEIILGAGDELAVTTTLFSFSPDTLIALYRADGTLLAWDDAPGSDRDYINWTVDVSGSYFIAVTGFDDVGFANNGVPDGDHTQSGFYVLTVAVDVIPEPATLVLLGLGGIGILIHRRRK